METAKLFNENLTVADMAKQLGISVQAIYKWEVVPLNRVRAVSELTGIPPEKLRPDFFGALEQQVSEAAQ